MICDKYRIIMIRMPKTASNSIISVLPFSLISKDRNKIRHVPAKVIRARNRNKFKKYFTCSFVRNPYTRFLSALNFTDNFHKANKYKIKKGFVMLNGLKVPRTKITKEQIIQQNKIREHDSLKSLMDDTSLLKALTQTKFIKSTSWNVFKPQWYFVCDNKDNIIVDYIGRYENLQEDFNYICDKVKCPKTTLPHKLETGKTIPRKFIWDDNPTIKEKIYSLYKKDFELFGYEK